ncbi:MAG TPA: nascent polypeptide-associated complex protein [Candidatus Nanoarchaeia archaeon]|nr:nascent polypeptide-associated complex protein [Candidatus Nanoarchaeia archaeon]
MDPRQVQQAMKKMGMKQESIPATEVIIKTTDKEFVIRHPQVAKVTMMGEESFQITGEVEEYTPVKEDDIQTVMEQTGCSKDEARKSLKEADGDLAQAILELQK